MRYQIDVSFSGQYDYEPGNIRITIPKAIWHKRANGSDTGEVQSALYGGLSLSVPDASSTKTDWHYEVNADGSYSIVNTNTIAATSKAMFQFTITEIYPQYIVDESLSDDLMARVEVVTNEGNTIYLDSNVLTAQIDTEEKLKGGSKGGTLYEYAEDVPSGLLANLPSGADSKDYLYVKWYVYPYFDGNQYFSLTGSDAGSVPGVDDTTAYVGVYKETVDEQTGEHSGWEHVGGATMLGAVDGSGNVIGSVSNNTWTNDIITKDFATNGMNQYNHVRYVWTAYKKSDFPELNVNYQFRNQAYWELTEQDPDADYPDAIGGTDPRLITTASSKDAVDYFQADWHYPPGRFLSFKYTESTTTHKHPYSSSDGPSYTTNGTHKKNYTYDLALNRLLKGQSAVMNYEVLSVGYGGIFTCGPLAGEIGWTDEDGNEHTGSLDPAYDENWNSADWAEDMDHYLNWYYVMDTTDRWEWFNIVDGNENSRLTESKSDDYRFLGVTIASPEIFNWDKQRNPRYYFENSTYGFAPDETIPKPAVEVWVEFDNKASITDSNDTREPSEATGWHYVGSFTVESGKTLYVDFESLGNVTGYRTRITSNQAATKLAVYPKIELKPSERVIGIVRQLFEDSETPSTPYRNDENMYVELYKYPEDPENTAPQQAYYIPEEKYYRQFINHDDSRATLTGGGYGVNPGKAVKFDAVADNNPEDRSVTLHYSATVTEVSNVHTVAAWNEGVRLGAIKPEKSGVWYDLLPEGVQPIMDTVKPVRSGDKVISKNTYPDWKGTGRILLVVEMEFTPSPRLNTSNIAYDEPAVKFDATYAWTDINNISARLVNYIAFESGDDERLGTLKNRIGEADAMVRVNNYATPDSEPQAIVEAFRDLDPASDEERFVYAKAVVNLNVDQMAQTEYVKSVKNDLVGIWTQGLEGQTQVNLYEGQAYTYRLRVASCKDTITSNMVMYDSLENYIIPSGLDEDKDRTKLADYNEVQSKKDWDGDWDRATVQVGAAGNKEDLEIGGQWRGKLVSIDLSDFIRQGCSPVIYYATEPWLQFGDTTGSIVDETIFFNYIGRYDTTDECWKKVPASDIHDGIWTVPEGTEVSAIALDLRKTADGGSFELHSQEAAYALLHMIAPDDHGDESQWHAKGAYAHKNEDGSASTNQDIDWDKALDPKNNMHAYNNTRLICSQADETNPSASSYITMIRNDYTRIGIMPRIIMVEKVWNDDDNHDNKRPQSVTVTMKRKLKTETEWQTVTDETTGKPLTVTLSEDNEWKDIFYQQDAVDEQGREWEYTFEENTVEGYTPSAQKIDDTHFCITNTHENEKTEVSGEKLWRMNDGQLLPAEVEALIPSSVTVKLYRTGSSGEKEYVKSLTVQPDEDGNWLYDFTGLDKYERGGFEYIYRVEEAPVKYFFSSTDDPSALPEGYEITQEYDPDSVELIYNFYFPFGDLQVDKEILGATAVSETQEFTYTLMLAGGDGLPVEGAFDYKIYNVTKNAETGKETLTEVSSGTIMHEDTFRLKGGQRIVIKKLPADATYALTEEQEDGWTLTGKAKDTGTVPTASVISASFTNTYRASGSAITGAKKSLTGHQLKRSQFRFELVDMTEGSETYGQAIRTAGNAVPEDTAQDPDTGVITNTSEFTFGALSYTEKDHGKTFTYEIHEVIPEGAEDQGDGTFLLNGYTYDAAVRTVTVTVTDNGDGTMTTVVTPEAPADNLFSNTYHAEGDTTLKAFKNLLKRDLKDQEFEFELWKSDETGAEIELIESGVLNDEEGGVTFSPLHFTQDDVTLDKENPAKYYYLVKEVRGTDPTIIYTESSHLFTVTVYDLGDGNLTFAQEGQAVDFEHVPCDTCGGTGKKGGVVHDPGVYYEDLGAYYPIRDGAYILSLPDEYFITCSTCGGTGLNGASPCPDCAGYGFTVREDKLEVCDHRALSGVYCYECGEVHSDTGTKYRQLIDMGSGGVLYYSLEYSPYTVDDWVEWLADCKTSHPGVLDYDLTPFEGGHGYRVVPCYYFRTRADYERFIADGIQSGWTSAFLAAAYSSGNSYGMVPDYMYLLGTGSEECPDCGGLGYTLGSPIVSAAGSVPVLTNDLKNGALQVNKYVTTPDPNNPDQEFLFHVKFTGEYLGDAEIGMGNGEGTETIVLPDTEIGTHTYYVPQPGDFDGVAYAVLYLEDEGEHVKGEVYFYRDYNAESIAVMPIDENGNELTDWGIWTQPDIRNDTTADMVNRMAYLSPDHKKVYFRGFEKLADYDSSIASSADGKGYTSPFASLHYDESSGSLVYDGYYGSESFAYTFISKLTQRDPIQSDTWHFLYYDRVLADGETFEFELDRVDMSVRHPQYGNYADYQDQWMMLPAENLDLSGVYFGDKPADVNYFMYYADYYNPSKLKSVVMPKIVLYDFYEAAYDCYSLESIDMSGVTWGDYVYLNYAFYNCYSLKSLDLTGLHPENTYYGKISYDFLYGTCSLRQITIEDDFYLYDMYDDNWFDPDWYPEMSTLPDEWHNTETGETLTSYELFSAPGHGGTWVRGDSYTVKFDGNGGSGSMPDHGQAIDIDYSFKPTFFKFGNRVGSVELYRDGELIGTLTPDEKGVFTIDDGISSLLENGDVITARMIWVRDDSVTNEQEMTIDFRLKDRERMFFDNIPASTNYEVWEETPRGWILVSKSGDSGAIEPLETALSAFTNEYAPNKTTASLTASKRLDGKLSKRAFTFGLYEVAADGSETLIDTKENTAGGVASFDILTYDLQADATAEGTHTYKIREIPDDPEDPTIVYDEHEETVTVLVEKLEDPQDPNAFIAQATVTYQDENGSQSNGIFRNTTKPGSLKITKAISGASEIAEGQSFTISTEWQNPDHSPLTGDYPVIRTEKDGTTAEETMTLDANGKASLTIHGGETLQIDELPAGVYYTLSETDIPAAWQQTSAEGEEGKIVSIQTKEASYGNAYSMKGEALIRTEKLVEDEAEVPAGYVFELVDANEGSAAYGTVLETVSNNATDQEETMTDPITAEEVANPDYGKAIAQFAKLNYTQEGVYTYRIREIAPAEGDARYDPKMVYDSREITVTVEMKDLSGDGTLTAAVSYSGGEGSDGNAFLNTYKPGSLQISKTIEDATEISAKQKFTVNITLKDRDGKALEGTFGLVRTDENGRETEEALTVAGGAGTITIAGGETVLINDLPHKSTWELTEQNVTGWIQTDTYGTTGTVEASETGEAYFVNAYRAEGKVVLKARKIMDPSDIPIPDEMFSFILRDEKGGELQRVKNDSNASGTFNPIIYTQGDAGKTFTYTILEQQGVNTATQTRYSFDTVKYTVKVTVTDNGDSTLSTKAEYSLDGENCDEAVFTNSSSVNIPIRKVWDADSDVEDEIRPEYVLVELLADGEVIATRSVAVGMALEEGGTVWQTMFTGMPEYKDGKKVEYTIREVESSAANYAASFSKDGSTLVVTNTYYETGITLGGTKQMKGRTLQEGEFSFTIRAEADDTPLPETCTVSNEADGSFSFGEVVYHLSDLDWDEDGHRLTSAKKTYLITEQIPAGAEPVRDGKQYLYNGVYYDATEQEVTVTLNFDPATGKFTAEVDKDPEEVLFVNESLQTGITVKKVWDDADDQDGKRGGVKATVTLMKTVGGKTVDLGMVDVSTDEGWSKKWDNLPAFEGGERIVYSIKETLKNANGYTSDTTEAVAVESGSTVTITNSYAPETVETTVKKIWYDQNDKEGKRPASLTVILSNGSEYELTAANEWTVTVSGLPKYEKGKEISYTWKEGNMPEGYSMSKRSESGTVTTFTNKLKEKEQPVNPRYLFKFTKEWQGGKENSIDFTFYHGDGRTYSHKFNKKKLSDTVWEYSAWLSAEDAEYYVIEEPVPGYETRYENVGAFADVTDRCYYGGKIINYKIPKTGDTVNLPLVITLVVCSALALAVVIGLEKRSRKRKQPDR